MSIMRDRKDAEPRMREEALREAIQPGRRRETKSHQCALGDVTKLRLRRVRLWDVPGDSRTARNAQGDSIAQM